MATFEFTPENVCSKKMINTHEGDIIQKFEVFGGCPGNLKGISSLLVGRKIDDVVSCLQGIACPGSRTHQTSCCDQISVALKAIQQLQKNK